jgi:Ca2+-binding EF-hand superfamily protein
MSNTEEEQRVLQNFLDRYDANDDEEVTKQEFETALLNEGFGTSTVNEIYKHAFANWDSDKNMRLSKKEVKELAKKWASFPGDQSK